jgi:hypothetical protein
LFTVKGGKFKLSAQGRDLAPFVGIKIKTLFEIKLPLMYKFFERIQLYFNLILGSLHKLRLHFLAFDHVL